MNYQTLSEIIHRLGEKAHLPQGTIEQFEVMTTRRYDGTENVMLAGLLPKNQNGATPLVMGCCRLIGDHVATDTERIDMMAIRIMPRWEEYFYDFGIRLGIEREQLQRMLIAILDNGPIKTKED